MELNKMGWHKQPCEHCQGEGSYVVHVSQFPDRLADDQKIMCQHCKGFGFKWVGPEEKK
jgi:DnaJ-class molecular chaperone